MRKIEYAYEFVQRYRELGLGQRHLVEESIRLLTQAEDPTLISHHLTRGQLKCNWSHRVKANLLIVFSASNGKLAFLSTGTHGQAYRIRR